MIFQYVETNILNAFEHGDFDAIVQGCNCFHTMGAGLAGQIFTRFYEAYQADLKTEFGDWGKMGDYSKATYAFGDLINGYTQFRPGRFPKADLAKNIEMLFTELNKDYAGKIIGIPYIGCGIAGGDWKEVSEIINRVTPDVKIVVCYMEQ